MISVIIPAYNVDKYIERCLDSVLAQSYSDLEIICVDDGSTDRTGKILDNYASKDDRVIVLHKANGGIISARKAGIELATADYVGWVDADDWIEANYFQNLMDAQESSGADIVTSELWNDMAGNSSITRGVIKNAIYHVNEVIPNMLYAGRFFSLGLQPHIVSKLMRREIYMKVLPGIDENISYGEDVAVFYSCVLEANIINVTNICGYHYVQHPKSVSRIIYNNELKKFQSISKHLKSMARTHEVYEVMKPQILYYQKYYMVIRMISALDTEDRILIPYGGISSCSKVIIYGAGVMGQQLYSYLSGIDTVVIATWLDRNYAYYQENGFKVDKPESICRYDDYDYILIAVTDQKVADGIRKYLLDQGVTEEKLLWLTDEFLSPHFTLDILEM